MLPVNVNVVVNVAVDATEPLARFTFTATIQGPPRFPVTGSRFPVPPGSRFPVPGSRLPVPPYIFFSSDTSAVSTFLASPKSIRLLSL
jgi:hypothetical protein